jgi:hypothetical protein
VISVIACLLISSYGCVLRSYEVNSPRANFFHGFNGTRDPEDDFEATDTSTAGVGSSKKKGGSRTARSEK